MKKPQFLIFLVSVMAAFVTGLAYAHGSSHFQGNGANYAASAGSLAIQNNTYNPQVDSSSAAASSAVSTDPVNSQAVPDHGHDKAIVGSGLGTDSSLNGSGAAGSPVSGAQAAASGSNRQVGNPFNAGP